ncbi:amidohydrolase [Sediminicola luteus]|uniref:Omega-amidase YafV n=1 Tax=Sediminicola luteus TaxID=319238 RepID=A0A2A4G326_9FLAO|nr:amidohydrolase [Sediminicola luteus]PCE62831.1 amidohydrolase [Sediminicola luteus]
MQLKVALMQISLVWESPEDNYARIENELAKLEAVDLVVLPETFTTGFSMHPERFPDDLGTNTLNWMKNLAQHYGFAIAGSTIFKEGDQYFNRFLFVHPHGEYEVYDKRHTFTLAGEDKSYTRGEKNVLIQYKGFRIRPLVCYDLRFPVWARNIDDYDLLLFVANWPKARVTAWDALLKARAIENMAYVIGVNRIGEDGNGYEFVGHSAVYDALGQQVAFTEEESVLYAQLEKSTVLETREKLRFLDDRDKFELRP